MDLNLKPPAYSEEEDQAHHLYLDRPRSKSPERGCRDHGDDDGGGGGGDDDDISGGGDVAAWERNAVEGWRQRWRLTGKRAKPRNFR